MTKESIEVKASRIDGRGVFATRDITEGEVILRWDLSHLVSVNDLHKVEAKDLHYLCRYNEDYFLINQTPYRYVNHSCDPNAETRDFSDTALREIKAGEEITTDYAKTTDGYAVEFICRCGSTKCRALVRKDIEL